MNPLRHSLVSFGLVGLMFAPWILLQSGATTETMLSEATSNTILVEGLATWKKITQRIAYLESENMTWESRFNPEREDRNWWNPLWRSSAERHLQRANENSLQLRDLEKQRLELEPRLLELTELYVKTLPARAAGFSASDRLFWVTVDAWRMPVWLRLFAEAKPDRKHWSALHPDLQARRKLRLEQLAQTARALDLYFTWRQSQLSESEQTLLPQLKTWQSQIRAWLNEIQPWLANIKPSVP